MPPSMFTLHNQLNGSHALVEAFKHYAPLGLRLCCIDEDGSIIGEDSYTIAYDHTLHEYMYYCEDVEEPMSASWYWLGGCNHTFQVTQAPTLPLQRLH